MNHSADPAELSDERDGTHRQSGFARSAWSVKASGRIVGRESAMVGTGQSMVGDAHASLEGRITSVDTRLGQLRAELSLLRSDLVRVALAIGAGTSDSSST